MKPVINTVPAVNIESSQEIMDKVETLTEVFSLPQGGEIIVDTRTFDGEDQRLTQLAAILNVTEADINDRLICLYV